MPLSTLESNILHHLKLKLATLDCTTNLHSC